MSRGDRLVNEPQEAGKGISGEVLEGKSPKGGWNNPLETKIGRGPCANCDSTRWESYLLAVGEWRAAINAPIAAPTP